MDLFVLKMLNDCQNQQLEPLIKIKKKKNSFSGITGTALQNIILYMLSFSWILYNFAIAATFASFTLIYLYV